MTITKKEKKKVSKDVSEIARSSSGVEIQDMSDSSSSVVTYKLDHGQNGGVETVTTYHTSESGQPVTQTVSYPQASTSSKYVQYLTDASSSHQTSSSLNTGFVEDTSVSYTVTEPKEELHYRKEGDSSWNGKFIYEQPTKTKIVSREPIVESYSTSSSSKKSSTVQKSSSSSYVIEIVDGKERIVDSKHHESGFAHQEGSEEHSAARSGTHVPTEIHHIQKDSDSKTIYDSAIPELIQPKSQSSELVQEFHSVDGQSSSKSYAVKDDTLKNIKIDKNLAGKYLQDKFDETTKSEFNKAFLEDKTQSDIKRLTETSLLDSTSSTIGLNTSFIEDKTYTTDTNKFYQSQTDSSLNKFTEDNKKSHSTTDSSNFYETDTLNKSFIQDSSDLNGKITRDSSKFYDTTSSDNIIKESYDTVIKSSQIISDIQSSDIQTDKHFKTDLKTDPTLSDQLIKHEKIRTDTNWDGTFTYEKTDNIKKKQTTSDSRNFFGSTATDYSTQSKSTYTEHGPVSTEKAPKSQPSSSKDFYGHSTGSDNVVVKNVYDTKATQNVIGGKSTSQKHTVIYDSNGKVIEDTTDIIFSNDRNYGKSGWNGKFTYETKDDKITKTDVTKTTKDDVRTTEIKYDTQTPDRRSPGRKTDGKSPDRKSVDRRSPDRKHPTKEGPTKITETTKTIVYDSTGKIIQDTTDVVFSYDKNQSGWNGKFTYETPQKPKDSPKPQHDGSPKKPGKPDEKTDEKGRPLRGQPTEDRITPKDTSTITSEHYETSDVKVFKDSKTFVDNKEIVESFIIHEKDEKKPKPDDKITKYTPDKPGTTINYQTSDSKNFVSKDSKTVVDSKTSVEHYIITEDGKRILVDTKTSKTTPEKEPRDKLTKYTPDKKQPKDKYTDTTVIEYQTSDSKNFTSKDSKTFVDSKTIVEHYIITEDGRRVLVDTKEDTTSKTIDRKGPQDGPTRKPLEPYTITENYEVVKNVSNTDIKKSVFEDVRSETFVDKKTLVEDYSYTDVSGVRDVTTSQFTDVVDRSVTQKFVDQKCLTDIRDVVSIIFG